MSIRYIEAGRQIILETQHTSYQMKIDELGYLQHQYYGARTGQEDLSYLSYCYHHTIRNNIVRG